MPDIRLRNGDELRPSAIAIHTDTLRVRTKMTATGETITAVPASDVAFTGDKIAGGETFHMIAHAFDDADEFVTDGNRHRDCLLRPGVPIIYMYVRSTDRCFDNADKNVIAVKLRNGNFFQPKSGLSPTFYDGFHCFLHGPKLSESGKLESRKSSAAIIALPNERSMIGKAGSHAEHGIKSWPKHDCSAGDANVKSQTHFDRFAILSNIEV